MKEEPQGKGVGILRPLGNIEEKRIEKRVNDILTHKKETTIIEGKLAVFAAKEPDKSTVVLLVASRVERAKRGVEGQENQSSSP